MKQKKLWPLVVLLALLLPAPFLFNPQATFDQGSDDQLIGVIEKIDPQYTPWTDNLWEASGEIATLLFSLQAAIGTGIIGYFIGLSKGKKTGLDQLQ